MLRTTLTAALLLTFTTSSLAQTAPVAPAQPHSPAAAPAPKAEPKSDKPAAYPEKVTKKLWAKNDLRGSKAPSLQVEAWRQLGKEIKTPDTKGKTVLVDFWGIGCPPCRTLIPELEAWQEKYKDDLVIIGLCSDTPKALDNFEDLRNAKIKYPLAIDTQNRTNKEVGVEGIPHVLLISSDGIVRWQGFPLWQEEPLTEAKLKQIIDADKAARGGGAKSTDKPADSEKDAKPAAANPVVAKPDDKK